MNRHQVLALVAATTSVGCQGPIFGSTPEPPRGSVSLVKTEGPTPLGYEGEVSISRSKFDSDGPAMIELRLRNTSSEPLPFDRFNDYPLGLVFPDDDDTNIALVGSERVDGGPCWRVDSEPLLTDVVDDEMLNPGDEISSQRGLYGYILPYDTPESNSEPCLPSGEYTFSRANPEWSVTLKLRHNTNP